MPFPSSWQKKAIDHTKGNIQIIACAGSGKTETIAARIVNLLISGAKPEEIVAFTFTNRAANELRNRVRTRVQEACQTRGSYELYQRISLLSCSTMHSFCFSLLRRLNPSFNIYEIISEHQEYALILRLGVSLGLSGNRQSLKYENDLHLHVKDEIESFLDSVDVVYNELIDENVLLDQAPKFLQVYQNYRAMLERQKLLSFGLIIDESVAQIKALSTNSHPLRGIKYLFVDEYQDTNTAQEYLIREFAKAGAEICTVGDDDQCIYEWRGSNIANFMNFSTTYSAKIYELPENRRCQPIIFEAAKGVAKKIKSRKNKTMIPASDLPPVKLLRISTEDPEEEANKIIQEIITLTSGEISSTYSYNEIAILLRSVATSGRFILERLSQNNIPFRLLGSTALLERPGINMFVLMFFAWAESIGAGPKCNDDSTWKDKFSLSLKDFINAYLLSESSRLETIEGQILDIGNSIENSKRPNIVSSLMKVFQIINICTMNPDVGQNPGLLADVGQLTNLVADVQAVFLRNIADSGHGDGKNLLNDLTWFIVRYASSKYEANLDFDPSLVNAIAICTVHQAKGLEWPVVFIPSLVDGRFPPVGKQTNRLLPSSLYPKEEYDSKYSENKDPERRIFYVAVTRARERLVLSDFKRIKVKRKPSPFYDDIPKDCLTEYRESSKGRSTRAQAMNIEDITCSELIEYIRCPNFYRFRRLWNWQADMPEELGYGTSLHHLANIVVQYSKKSDNIENKIDTIVDREFHMPYASAFTRGKLLENARVAIREFYKTFKDSLKFAEMSEQDMVLPFGDTRVNCRPDLIIRVNDSEKWVIDLKSINGFTPNYFDNLQIYAYVLALKYFGVDITKGSFYNFNDGQVVNVDIDSTNIKTAELDFRKGIEGIKNKNYNSVGSKCQGCDYDQICYLRKELK